MGKFRFLATIVIMVFLMGFFSPPKMNANTTYVAAQTGIDYDFSFMTTDLELVSLGDFSDQVILLEWGASWCTVCENNQISMNEIYDEYSDRTQFISLSYGDSGDDMDDVREMKARGPYEWLFGNDNTKFSRTIGATNGDTMVFSQNLTLIETWDYQIVTANSLREALDEALGETGKTYEDEISYLGLDKNPLFLGFVGISILGIFVVLILKSRRSL